MKGKLRLVSNVFVFIVGLLLILLHSRAQIFDLIIMLIGILFIVPSCISLINVLAKKGEGSMRFVSLLPIIGGLALGISMVVVPEFYFGILAYTFAAILIIGGLFKFWTLVMMGKVAKLPVVLYVIPTLMLVCGIILITTSVREIQSVLVLITGIALVAYSVDSLMDYFVMKKIQKAQTATNVIEEAKVEEVK